MKLFKVEITKMEPVTIIARDNDSAAEHFVMAFGRGFGNFPTADYAVTEWNPRDRDGHIAVLDFAKEGRTGIAWPSSVPGGWELYAPWEG